MFTMPRFPANSGKDSSAATMMMELVLATKTFGCPHFRDLPRTSVAAITTLSAPFVSFTIA
jgi:hypothetical protein